MKSETSRKGEVACAKFDLACAEKGFVSSRPLIDCPYDRIVDNGTKLCRVQIKYADGKASHTTGAVPARLSKTIFRRSKDKARSYSVYSAQDIDAIVVYVAKVDKLCWFDAKIIEGKTSIQIRLEPPKNGQRKGFHFINDYLW